MLKFYAFLLLASMTTSCARKVYVVRHAEKAAQEKNMSSDVPLSAAGEKRALALLDVLKDKNIQEVYSTQTIRTITTAQPVQDHFQLTIKLYGPRPDSIFINRVRESKKNMLIVGHSNTVDDIVNGIAGKKCIPGDLPDTAYDNLYLLKISRKKVTFRGMKYGVKS
jgi:phosphohistidine phosphatase SixA